MPILEAIQKNVDFYHHKDIDMLKLGCTLPKMAKFCLQKSTDAKFYPFMERDRDFQKKFEKMLLVVDLSFAILTSC